MIIDAKQFYVLCAQAVRTHAVVLVNRNEYEDRMAEEDLYLKQKQQIPMIYGPFAKAGYQNFIATDDGFPYDGTEIITLFEVVG